MLIAIGINPSKYKDNHLCLGDLLSTSNARAKELEEKINRKVEVYSTFLHEFIESKEKEGYKVVLIRGLRNGDDLSYEDNQLKFIRDFKPDIDVIFIMCDAEYEHISSSSIRQLESFRPGSSSKYIL